LVIHFGFDAPEAAAELTQGDEQPGSKVRRLRMRLNPSVRPILRRRATAEALLCTAMSSTAMFPLAALVAARANHPNFSNQLKPATGSIASLALVYSRKQPRVRPRRPTISTK
jgi:hypothetical protein